MKNVFTQSRSHAVFQPGFFHGMKWSGYWSNMLPQSRRIMAPRSETMTNVLFHTLDLIPSSPSLSWPTPPTPALTTTLARTRTPTLTPLFNHLPYHAELVTHFSSRPNPFPCFSFLYPSLGNAAFSDLHLTVVHPITDLE